MKSSWLVGVAGAALCFSMLPAHAQATQTVDAVQGPQSDADQPPPGEIATAESVVVMGEITYRNRSDEAGPVLEYGTDYFQRFEPLSAGDALKRVPSVTFLSDVIESDGARMRGLDPGYTQILIDGEQVPGSNDDRSFFMDRIPAELIERVEIIRSPSANRSGDAVAGALNIVLRDGYSLEGGYVRAGAMLFDDGRVRESLAGVWGGEVGPGRLLLGANIQGRRNPKVKQSLRFGDSPENNPNFFVDDFDNREDQLDTRNGTDYSANASYQVPMEEGNFEINGFVVHTDRTESEFSVEYDDPTSLNPAGIQTIVPQFEDILQDNYSVNARFDRNMFGGESTFRVGFAEFKDDIVGTEEESEYDPFPTLDDFGGERTLTGRTDREIKAKLSHARNLFGDVELDFGIDYQTKDRETDIRSAEIGAPGDIYTDFELDNATVVETRLDGYAMLSGGMGAVRWEGGLRYETTDVDTGFALFDDAGVLDDEGSASTDYGILLPSAHVKWNVTDNDRLSFSVARTVRRPNFNFITPITLEEEVGDDDLRGNPELDPETAWGGDIGYERRLGRQGVFGINAFYRQVEDLIEVVNTGEEGSGGPGTFVLSVDNVGDGEVYGVEIDLSTPLDFIGLPDTGVFLNYSWLDSKVEDVFGERMFNDQADFVYNIGFIHDMSSLDAAFGATFRKQGDAYGRVLLEEVATSYGEDLEVFIEKSFGENFTLRIVGQNLLDGSKDEVFNKFDTIADQIARDFDEYEVETEKAGPVIQLIGRYAF
jgi:outer membrane receptor protein involved in Fe transport